MVDEDWAEEAAGAGSLVVLVWARAGIAFVQIAEQKRLIKEASLVTSKNVPNAVVP